MVGVIRWLFTIPIPSSQTAKFVAEAGISLANDETSLPQNYGVLTPSTAMGNVLTDRLRLKGVDFSMEK